MGEITEKPEKVESATQIGEIRDKLSPVNTERADVKEDGTEKSVKTVEAIRRKKRIETTRPNLQNSSKTTEGPVRFSEITLKLPRIEEDYALVEAIKAMRTNIEFSGEENKVILLTSGLRDAGKSFISMNLAMSLAEKGKRVFYIDADLRKSVLIGRYRIKGQYEGLSHYLVGRCNIDSAIVTTNIRNLDMVLAGHKPPNPSELLGGKRFTNLVRRLREVYDYVIIDTPPIGEVIDAAVIAKACDGAIIVTAYGHNSYRFLNGCKNQIEKSGCKVMGVILNKVPKERRGGYGKYYGQYYGHYYGEYGSNKKAGRNPKDSAEAEK